MEVCRSCSLLLLTFPFYVFIFIFTFSQLRKSESMSVLISELCSMWKFATSMCH